VLRDNTLQFTNSTGVKARLSYTNESGNLWLLGKNGTIHLDTSSPGVEVTDNNGFAANLRSSELVTPAKGESETTSAASLVLSGKNGRILWRSPR
jgi:hypothetical protein